MYPKIEIDQQSGFCFGVINAVKHAEEELAKDNKELYCLGDIVHTNQEVDRLEAKGMQTINYETFSQLQGKRVLFRAHGEAPAIYQMAKERGIELVDATCPVVLALQKKVRRKFAELDPKGGQIVIYGKKGHAEVNGLVGQTAGKAIIVQSREDIEQIDFTRPIALFSQTTQSLTGFHELIDTLQSRMVGTLPLSSKTRYVGRYPTVCLTSRSSLHSTNLPSSLPEQRARTGRCSSATARRATSEASSSPRPRKSSPRCLAHCPRP